MILRELFYFDKETLEPVENNSYDPKSDDSIMKKDDTRKTRLTSDLHKEEQDKELHFVRQMYGLSANAEAAV